jgi:sRNA-binding carbon storage regulator CsrA
MLVLTRKPGESIHIYPSEDIDPHLTIDELFSSGPIVIQVRESKRGGLRIAISAS